MNNSVVVILVIVIGIATFLSGFFTQKSTSRSLTKPEIVAGSCCDSGDGDACKPSSDADKIFTFQGQQYGLLKSDITLTEAVYHLKDSGEKFNGDPIILNYLDGYSQAANECGKGKDDQVWGQGGCVAIPDDEIVYVCRKNCTTDVSNIFPYCNTSSIYGDLSCYGKRDTKYDVYFRLADFPTPGVPEVIKNCTKVVPVGNEPGQQQIVIDDPGSSTKNLQLKTFKVVQQVGSIPWLSPYCKPAIYLYPKEKMPITVKLAPKGNLTTTIPDYPESGWNVIADKDGSIWSNNNYYRYLYYEAQIPDEFVNNEQNGYVISYNDLPSFFNTILPRLGLSNIEQKDFTDYWLSALPKSPYYKINIVPLTLLNEISPLFINPVPDSLIRVTLYFTPLEEKIDIPEPILPSVKRDGFTVVEWGGLFKQDKNHPFTCLQ